MKIIPPNDLGINKFLVEDCWGISINIFLNNYKQKMKEIFLASEIELNGLKLDLITSKTNFNGTRYWFKCPICHTRIGSIYKHPLADLIGCRKCLNLEYRKRRYKGMIEGKL